MLISNLASFCVHMVIVADNKLRHRNNFIPLFLQPRNHIVERSGGVSGAVVAENDGTVTEMLVLTDSFDDGVGTVVFPIERVHDCYKK